MMTLEEFEERVTAAWEEIPAEFRARVEGPVVVPEARRSRGARGVYILGECLHAPDWSGTSELLSTVVLYYGSFAALARSDPEFDVAEEIRETVVHEVQHHVEDRVGKPRLRDQDWAGQQNTLRRQGRRHAPRFWRGGERLEIDGRTLYGVHDDLFLELPLRHADWQRARREGIELHVGRRHVALPPGQVPDEQGLFTFPGRGRTDGHASGRGELVLAVWRRRGPLERLRRLLGLKA
jgi:predicted Zn-dependent protease with MMP-like domain